MDQLLGILIVAAVIAIGAVLFGVWAVVAILRGFGRGVAWLLRPGPPPLLHGSTMLCPRSACRAINPSSAHFCRRCGQELLKGYPVHRRAAAW